MRHVLIISGDRADSAGPFNASLEIIESGMLQQHGITHVSIAGHPDGHPVVADDVMQRALLAKVEAAEQSGLDRRHRHPVRVRRAARISRWIMKMRDLGIECPIRIGMAGPTNLTTLLKFAQRCGVKASIGGVTKHAGLVKHLFGVSAPDALVRALADENCHRARSATSPRISSRSAALPRPRNGPRMRRRAGSASKATALRSSRKTPYAPGGNRNRECHP